MRISEVAERSGVPVTTLRFYESVGLLDVERLPNGYRSYREQALGRLAFIQAAKHVGLELDEIREVLEVADSGTCTAVRAALHPLLVQRLGEVSDTVRALIEAQQHLVAAERNVAICPDSTRACRSECAFSTLTQAPSTSRPAEAGYDKSLCGPPTRAEGDEAPFRVELSADRFDEAIALLRECHRSWPSVVLQFDPPAATITVTSP